MTTIPRLETDRLILREFEDSDILDTYNYCKNSKVGPMAGWASHSSVEETKNVIKLFKEEMFMVFAIEYKANNKVIGSIGLHKSKKRDLNYDLELGFALSEDYWGKGLMPEAAKKVIEYAFSTLSINTLCCSHFPSNKQSKRVIEKCGFKFYGTIEKSWENYDGSILDEECYLLTKDEYNNSNAIK